MAPSKPRKTQHEIENHHERRKAAGSINAFAEQKGVTRSIRNFKHRQETKQNIKASQLREYRKVMKREGMEASRGTSRKREDNDDNDEAKKNTVVDPDEKIRHKRKPKMNPLTKSLQKKKERFEQQATDRLQHDEDAKKLVKRQKQRQRQSKLMSRKTQRGQPMMKHMINNLLTKMGDK
mmetsp:Transcript_30336/g.50101  ORF Transcript_30336/g.50101 Transcript_30336/m.50101 type:complete len:179 (-) Transcript_30336:89-625(-)